MNNSTNSKKVLFIHSSLSIGGIETFFARLAPRLNQMGMDVNFLILYKSDYEVDILQQLKSCARVFFWEDICRFSFRHSEKLNLLGFVNRKKLIDLFLDVDVVHVGNALQYFIAKKIFTNINKKPNIVFGVYQSNILVWSFNQHIPYYEKKFRKEISKNTTIYFPNSYVKSLTYGSNCWGPDVSSFVFPLGVEFSITESLSRSYDRNELRICSVGRLVAFKTYNSHMIETVLTLKSKKLNIKYDVFGFGPELDSLTKKVVSNNLSDSIKFKGNIEYQKLNNILLQYDLFVGSGTALLQAAALGIPCIIGIENEPKAFTYGFFSEITGLDYHEQFLPFPRVTFSKVIEAYINMDASERACLHDAHLNKARIFSIDNCAVKFYEMMMCSRSITNVGMSFYSFILHFMISEFTHKLFFGRSYFDKDTQSIRLGDVQDNT